MGQHRDSKTPAAPHDCPQCGEPCYIGFGINARCTNRECQWYDKDLWVEHVLSLPDEPDHIFPSLDIEDAPTQPKVFPAVRGWIVDLTDDD